MYCVLDPSADYVVSTYDVRTYVLVFVIALANHRIFILCRSRVYSKIPVSMLRKPSQGKIQNIQSHNKAILSIVSIITMTTATRRHSLRAVGCVLLSFSCYCQGFLVANQAVTATQTRLQNVFNDIIPGVV